LACFGVFRRHDFFGQNSNKIFSYLGAQVSILSYNLNVKSSRVLLKKYCSKIGPCSQWELGLLQGSYRCDILTLCSHPATTRTNFQLFRFFFQKLE